MVLPESVIITLDKFFSAVRMAVPADAYGERDFDGNEGRLPGEMN